MNLSQLPDSSLLSNTKELARQEREILTQVLHHLREIERRRLFSALKYKSLFEYAIKELSYSEDQAYRRISAMRLLAEIPQIEEKIGTGSLTLSNLGVAATAIRAHKVTGKSNAQFKIRVVELVENKSKRQAEEILLKENLIEKEALRSETHRVHEEHVELRLTITHELEAKIQKLKSLLAHSNPNMTTTQLFEKLCETEIARFEKQMQPRPTDAPGDTRATKKQCAKLALNNRRPNISKRRVIWQRDGGKCTNCDSTHALQVDHVKPIAQGGGNEPTNLRLLCRSCNQRAAIEQLGHARMQPFLERRKNN